MSGRVVDGERPAVDEHYNCGDAGFHDGLNQLILRTQQVQGVATAQVLLRQLHG